MKLTAIILAAGFSLRMGDFKPLMNLGGRSLLGHCAATFYRTQVAAVTVVSGHRHLEVEAETKRLGLRCLYNPDYTRGMYSSIQMAVHDLGKTDGFFILPVDIPLVRPATITALSAAFDGSTVIVPTFNGVPGHPPLLPAALIPAILDHDGQGGLQYLLQHLPASAIKRLSVWDRGVLLDADTQEDLAVLTTILDTGRKQ